MSTTYAFQNISAHISGDGLSTDLGYGAAVAGEGITVAPTGDRNTMTIGADGSAMHSLHADRSGTITVRLQKTSPANAILQTAMNYQMNTPSSHGSNTIVIRDHVSGDQISATSVAFRGPPTITYAVEGGGNEWTFHAGRIDQVLG